MDDLTKMILTALLTTAGTYVVIRSTEGFKGSVSYTNRVKEIQVAKFHDKMLSSLEGLSLRLSKLGKLVSEVMNPLNGTGSQDSFDVHVNKQVATINEVITELRNYHDSMQLYLPMALNDRIETLGLEYIRSTQEFIFKFGTGAEDLPSYYEAAMEKTRWLGEEIKGEFRRLINSDLLAGEIKIGKPSGNTRPAKPGL